MFGNTIDKLKEEPKIAKKVEPEFVVRNMPSMARLSGTAFVSSTVVVNPIGGSAPQPGVKHNFKMVGLVIIIGGLIFIGGLFYLSYVYIIKPQIKKSSTPIAAPAPVKKDAVKPPKEATSTEQLVVPVTAVVATVTPDILNLASSSASSTMNEELNGKQNTNLPPLIDSDSDGLNDEEEALLGTNASSTDSNGNTYTDLTELNNNYDPAGKGKISNNASLNKYFDKALALEILYPKIWSAKSLGDDSTIVFTAIDDSIIQISVQENTDNQSILGWYGNSFPDITPTYDKIKSTDNWDGIFSDDNLNFYLTDKKRNNIYVVSYIPAVDGRLSYPNIFQLMINSLTLK